MASRSDVERLVKATRGIDALVRRDLERFWATLDLADPVAARDALLRYVPALVQRWGEGAALIAADWYDGVRAAAGAPGLYRATLSPATPAEQLARTLGYHSRALFGDDPERTLRGLLMAASALIRDRQAQTIIQSGRKDPWGPRFARVPRGTKTCAFCLMLASRGAIYWTRESAGAGWANRHGSCDCAIVPIGPFDDYPDGYDPDALYDKYAAARDAAPDGSTKAILAELRSQQGIH